MGGQTTYMVGTLRKCARAVVVVFFILGITLPFTSCADLREEFDTSKWRYRPVPDAPPSWENDYGRPDMPDSGGGDFPFQ